MLLNQRYVSSSQATVKHSIYMDAHPAQSIIHSFLYISSCFFLLYPFLICKHTEEENKFTRSDQIMSASRSNYPHGSSLKVAVTVAYFILSLLFLSLKSDGFVISGQNYVDYDQSLVLKKMALGSKPPACVNKCLNCRPCVAALVIPSHQRKGLKASSSSHGEDDNYYLLSWKCRCGNKLFQP